MYYDCYIFLVLSIDICLRSIHTNHQLQTLRNMDWNRSIVVIVFSIQIPFDWMATITETSTCSINYRILINVIVTIRKTLRSSCRNILAIRVYNTPCIFIISTSTQGCVTGCVPKFACWHSWHYTMSANKHLSQT